MSTTLYLGDCVEVMRGLDAGSVDAVIADPPYGTTACKWDSVIPFAPMWEQLRRVVKPSAAIVLFASQPFTSALVMSNPKEFRYEWVWDKKLSSGHLNTKYRPLLRHETIAVFAQERPTYSPQMRTGAMRHKEIGGKFSECYGSQRVVININDQYHPTSILEFSNANRRSNVHPTQKPVDILAYLVRTYTNPGETVLDFCFGSGTTGVACIQENRRFIGIEQDPAYYAIAERRIAAAQPPLPMQEVAD